MIVAETGADMSAFPTAKRLASWAGQCPGNDQSAGKRRSGRTRKGSRWLGIALTEAALAATRTKDTYLAAQYRRLRPRRGHKRALGATRKSVPHKAPLRDSSTDGSTGHPATGGLEAAGDGLGCPGWGFPLTARASAVSSTNSAG